MRQDYGQSIAPQQLNRNHPLYSHTLNFDQSLPQNVAIDQQNKEEQENLNRLKTILNLIEGAYLNNEQSSNFKFEKLNNFFFGPHTKPVIYDEHALSDFECCFVQLKEKDELFESFGYFQNNQDIQ